MRISLWATTVCLLAIPLVPTGASPAAAAGPLAAPATSMPSAPLQPTEPAGNDAARHAKRTACLNEARTKKLVGERRNQYIKHCMSA